MKYFLTGFITFIAMLYFYSFTAYAETATSIDSSFTVTYGDGDSAWQGESVYHKYVDDFVSRDDKKLNRLYLVVNCPNFVRYGEPVKESYIMQFWYTDSKDILSWKETVNSSTIGDYTFDFFNVYSTPRWTVGDNRIWCSAFSDGYKNLIQSFSQPAFFYDNTDNRDVYQIAEEFINDYLADGSIDLDGFYFNNDPLKCPSDVLMTYMDYMGSDYGNTEGVAPRLYFYPEDVLGKKIVVKFTYKYNTFVKRDMSLMEQMKHPTYALSGKECPRVELEFTRQLELDIPETLDKIPEFNTFDNVLSIPPLFYDVETNKIVVMDYPKYKDIKNEIHNCIKNYPFKIGTPVCVDCNPFAGNPYKNEYKHIGKAVSISADCQLFKNDKATPIFNIFLKINKNSSDISTYTNPDDGNTSVKNDGQANVFAGTNQDGEKNDFGNKFSDSEWDSFLNGSDTTKIDDNMTFSDAISWLKKLTKTLKEFPNFFAEFFSYLPLSDEVGITFMAIILVGLIVGFLKLIIS